MEFLEIAISFIISLSISAIIIYIATKLLGEEEGFVTAIVAAGIGAVLFTIVSYVLSAGLLASLVGGFTWLLALKSLYNIGWLKSMGIAIIIWVFASVVSMLLPTITGPL